MKPNRIIPILLAIPLLLAATTHAALAADPAYTIKMHRLSKAGDLADIHTLLEITKVAMINHAEGPQTNAESQSIKADLAARLEITAVDDTGAETSLSLTIQKFTTGDNDSVAIETGKIVDIARTEKEVTFKLRGEGELSANAKLILDLLYTKLSPSKLNDDDIYGTKTPQSVGQSWSVNTENAAKDLKSSIDVDPKNLNGIVTLKGVEQINGADALRLACTMSTTHFRPTNFLSEIPFWTSEAKVEFISLYPVDPAQRALSSATAIDIHAVTMNPNDPTTSIDIKAHMSIKSAYTPIKK